MTNNRVDERTEYQCAYTFHSDLIKSRFTVADLYVASSGVVISKVAELVVADDQGSYVAVSLMCLAMIVISVVCILLEKRSQFLYRAIGKRLAHLESELARSAPKGKKPFFFFCYKKSEGRRFPHGGRPAASLLRSHSAAFMALYVSGVVGWGGYPIASLLSALCSRC